MTEPTPPTELRVTVKAEIPKWAQVVGVIAFAFVACVFVLDLIGVVLGVQGDTTDLTHWIGDGVAVLAAFALGLVGRALFAPSREEKR